MDYLDLYLVHWPFPNYHAPGVEVTAATRTPALIHEKYMKTWRQMEKLVDLGLVRHIGTSNMTIPKMELAAARCADQPPATRWNCTPTSSSRNCSGFVVETASSPSVIRPLARPAARIATRLRGHRRHGRPGDRPDRGAVGRPPRGRLPQVGDPARPDPDSVLDQAPRTIANLQAVVSAPLTEADMPAIAGIDQNCRLIKGQVFCGKRARRLGRPVGLERGDHAAVASKRHSRYNAGIELKIYAYLVRKMTWEEHLAELNKIHELCEQHQRLLPDVIYQSHMEYLAALKVDRWCNGDNPTDLESNLAGYRSQSFPVTVREAEKRLRAYEPTRWQITRLLGYASWIQLHGWQAVEPKVAEQLRSEYAHAGIDAEAIDFNTPLSETSGRGKA